MVCSMTRCSSLASPVYVRCLDFLPCRLSHDADDQIECCLLTATRPTRQTLKRDCDSCHLRQSLVALKLQARSCSFLRPTLFHCRSRPAQPLAERGSSILPLRISSYLLTERRMSHMILFSFSVIEISLFLN